MMILAAILALVGAQPASQPVCTSRQAQATTIEAITAAPERWLDRCVTVSGIADGLRLYSGVEGVYRSRRFGADGNFVPENLRHRIGIDSQNIRTDHSLGERASRITVIGTVDSCERRTQRIRDQGRIAFLGGYCHYESGPTIVVSHHEVHPGRFFRLIGEEARRRLGNLAIAPAGWSHRVAVERIARDYLTAVRARDRAVLVDLHAEYGDRQRDEVLTWLLDDPASSFRRMRNLPPSRSEILIIFREGNAPGTSGEHFGAEVCFCRSGDCTGRWPIALRDADAGADRPYACIHVERRTNRPRGAIVYTPRGGGWLAEPR